MKNIWQVGFFLLLGGIILLESGVFAKDEGDIVPGARRFIQHFDRNGDGLVSEDEFPGPADHFDELDINGDGYIDPSEAPKVPPPHPPHHMMERNKN